MAKTKALGLTKAGKPRKRASKKITKGKKDGRPSKLDTIHYEGVKLCYTKGFTDAETASALQITPQTLCNWKLADPNFFKSLKDWKHEADRKVVRSLYERAHGYNHVETKAQWVNGSDGEPGRWETLDMIKHYPPDPTSMIFWLKNRDRENWRDKVDTEITGEVKVIIVDYSKVDSNA